MRVRSFLAILLTLAPAAGYPDAASLAQLDASRLLITQRVDAYVSVTDDNGVPREGLDRGAFRVSESSDGQSFRPVASLLRFQPRAGAENGIAFLLLLDNSGSMYDSLDGRPTEDPAAMRITHAKDAVRAFLSSMTNPRDRVGLASFNTFFTPLSAPAEGAGAAGRDRIVDELDRIARPSPDQAYTELYASLTLAARKFAGVPGRKAIIILSDGENYPYAQYSGKEHPVFGKRRFAYTEPIVTCQEEGVTVYGINFGKDMQPDPNLQAITRETGGRLFSAGNRDELAGVYQQIHRQVAAEYLLTWRAGTDPAEKRYVRVSVSAPGGEVSATRFYFAGTVFGLPLPRVSVLFLLPLLAAAALLAALVAVRLERKPGPARLEVLQTRIGHPVNRTVVLGAAKTVIGSSPKADLTISGSPHVKEHHATILHDPRDKSYTIASTGDVMVNNQPVKTRKLEPGDVIDVGGSTIVFEGEEKKESGK
jgi:Ca-activated chloride channel family protein